MIAKIVIAKIVIYVVIYVFIMLLLMFIRKRAYIKSMKNVINSMHNKSEIDDKTKEGFELLLKCWEKKSKWYNKIF